MPGCRPGDNIRHTWAANNAAKQREGDVQTEQHHEQRPLRQHLVELLRGGHAHLDFEKAVADLPPKLRGVEAGGAAA